MSPPPKIAVLTSCFPKLSKECATPAAPLLCKSLDRGAMAAVHKLPSINTFLDAAKTDNGQNMVALTRPGSNAMYLAYSASPSSTEARGFHAIGTHEDMPTTAASTSSTKRDAITAGILSPHNNKKALTSDSAIPDGVSCHRVMDHNYYPSYPSHLRSQNPSSSDGSDIASIPWQAQQEEKAMLQHSLDRSRKEDQWNLSNSTIGAVNGFRKLQEGGAKWGVPNGNGKRQVVEKCRAHSLSHDEVSSHGIKQTLHAVSSGSTQRITPHTFGYDHRQVYDQGKTYHDLISPIPNSHTDVSPATTVESSSSSQISQLDPVDIFSLFSQDESGFYGLLQDMCHVHPARDPCQSKTTASDAGEPPCGQTPPSDRTSNNDSAPTDPALKSSAFSSSPSSCSPSATGTQNGVSRPSFPSLLDTEATTRDLGENTDGEVSDAPSKSSHRCPKRKRNEPSYIAIISMAILQSQEKKLLLSDIYSYVSRNFSSAHSGQRGWRNSVRHTLSVNECFVKQERLGRGRGHYWIIHPACLQNFMLGDFRRRQARRRAKKTILVNNDYAGAEPRIWHGLGDIGGVGGVGGVEGVAGVAGVGGVAPGQFTPGQWKASPSERAVQGR